MNILSIVGTKDLSSGGPIYLANSQKKFFKKEHYIKIINLNHVNFFKIFLYLFGFRKKKLIDILLKFDVVHFHEVWNFRNHLLAFKLRFLSIPFIFSVHGHFDKWSVNHNSFIKNLFIKIFKKNFTLAAGLQISSIEEINEARMFFHEKKNNFFLISNGVEIKIDETTSKTKVINNTIKLLFFGRIHPKKGIHIILGALRNFIDTKKKYLLSIVGPGTQVHLKQVNDLIDNLKLNSYVKIFKPVFNEMDKIYFFNNSDIFILPSFEEADSIALKESLACGLPVIISKQCRLNDVVNYNCGLIIDNNTIEDLMSAIEKMSNKNLLNIMRVNGIRLINDKYTSDLMHKNLLLIYKDVIHGTRLAKNWSCNNIPYL
jgi:poly(glycerol-phosphate) alpha-glucosyltransferase